MSDRSKIEWTDASWNPIRARLREKIGRKAKNALGWHCTHVSEGCRNCYAEGMNRRLGTGLDYKPGHEKDIEIYLDEEMLRAPLRWRRPRKIFVGSMTDLFADFVKDERLDRIFAVMALCPRHTFQVLTKRPERMRDYVNSSVECFHASGQWREDMNSIAVELTPCAAVAFDDIDWPLPNVWLGASCEDQPTADERIPHLLATPAAVRFLSCEPLLGPIDTSAIKFEDGYCNALSGHHGIVDDRGYRHSVDGPTETIDWIICGGESGPHARPMHPDWARSLRDQCAAASVPFFFKQWGEWEIASDENGHFVHDMGRNSAYWIAFGGSRHKPNSIGLINPVAMVRVGKSRAGRKLDGTEHNAFPTLNETAEAQRRREKSP